MLAVRHQDQKTTPYAGVRAHQKCARPCSSSCEHVSGSLFQERRTYRVAEVAYANRKRRGRLVGGWITDEDGFETILESNDAVRELRKRAPRSKAEEAAPVLPVVALALLDLPREDDPLPLIRI